MTYYHSHHTLTIHVCDRNITRLSMYHQYQTHVDLVGETVGGISGEGQCVAFVLSERAVVASSVASVTICTPIVTLGTKRLGPVGE